MFWVVLIDKNAFNLIICVSKMCENFVLLDKLNFLFTILYTLSLLNVTFHNQVNCS